MNLDINTILECLLGALWAIMAWNFKQLQTKADSTEKDLQAYKTYVATTHVTDSQLSKALESLNHNIEKVLQTVDKIEDRLYKKEQQ